MGRKPIGKRAMTAAERQARHREMEADRRERMEKPFRRLQTCIKRLTTEFELLKATEGTKSTIAELARTKEDLKLTMAKLARAEKEKYDRVMAEFDSWGSSRKLTMDDQVYKLIQSFLHPDRATDPTEKQKRHEALTAFHALPIAKITDRPPKAG